MSEDNLTQRDILFQMMTDVRETRKEVVDQRLLLTQHMEASIARDQIMHNIKENVEKIEVRMEQLSLRVSVLENLKLKLVGIWLVVSAVGYLVLDFIYRKFLG